MSIRKRLDLLERATIGPTEAESVDPFVEIEQHVAYLCGEGPRPLDQPCPPWIAPESWAARIRVADATDSLFRGDQLPDGLAPAELAAAEAVVRAARSAAEMMLSDGSDERLLHDLTRTP